jgi:hypothetical protein
MRRPLPTLTRRISSAFTRPLWAIALAAASALLPSAAAASFVVFEGAGAGPAAITSIRDSFRSAVGGGSAAGANGDFGGLRREINWDGVPAGFSDPNALPGNFFNVNSPRGAVFSTPGSGFLVSGNAGGAVPTLFGFGSDLQAFSAQKLFASVDSNVTDVQFFVPGTSTAATTSAFGLVFVDAETSNATQLEFFDTQGALIFSRFAPAGGNQGLSFLGGVALAGEQIARVRITTPTNYLISNGVRATEAVDFVVMDDFLYASPVAAGVAGVPVPAPLALGLLGLAGLAARRISSRRADRP